MMLLLWIGLIIAICNGSLLGVGTIGICLICGYLHRCASGDQAGL